MAAFSSNEDIQLVTFFLEGEEYGVDVMPPDANPGMDVTSTPAPDAGVNTRPVHVVFLGILGGKSDRR